MIDRDEQISRMSKEINEMGERNAHYYDENLEQREAYADCDTIAKHLYDKGYRWVDEDYARQCTCYALGCLMADKIERNTAKITTEAVLNALGEIRDEHLIRADMKEARAIRDAIETIKIKFEVT